MKKTFDVVVIGGGIIGLSSAYYLLSSGKKVALIEKNHIGSGASGACDDMILLQSKKPGVLLEMAMESLNLYRNLSQELKIDIEFETRGGMIFIENQQQLEVMEPYVKKQRSYGLDVHLIEKRDVKKRHPFATDAVIASTYSDKDSQVNPLKVMRGFLGRSLAMGLELRKQTRITELSKKNGCWNIECDQGSPLESQYVVNAAGAWAADIGKLVGIDIPIVPQKGQIVVTEKIPTLGQENIWSAEYIVSKLLPELMNTWDELTRKLGLGFAFSQTHEGNYLIGSTRELGIFDKRTDFVALNILVKQAVKFFPILKNINVIRCFAGLRPAVSDGTAIISEVADRKGFYIAAGHGGDGIALAPITGKLIAKFINGEEAGFNMNEVSFQRFQKN
ncbi:dimethylglycine dehydrogenase [Candidatus Vecturithrix granuli]|uniref:Dimethylglycine dehydrogenase n=1 Tax=Vecturithrix granuli TaxID=1499967 RepID=A0A081C806_VECG1|nr:dimethylglycine dehydrogenase [Candidatus Vecturithrix granuli]